MFEMLPLPATGANKGLKVSSEYVTILVVTVWLFAGVIAELSKLTSVLQKSSKQGFLQI